MTTINLESDDFSAREELADLSRWTGLELEVVVAEAIKFLHRDWDNVAEHFPGKVSQYGPDDYEPPNNTAV